MSPDGDESKPFGLKPDIIYTFNRQLKQTAI
jgi:hypothetical protein